MGYAVKLGKKETSECQLLLTITNTGYASARYQGTIKDEVTGTTTTYNVIYSSDYNYNIPSATIVNDPRVLIYMYWHSLMIKSDFTKYAGFMYWPMDPVPAYLDPATVNVWSRITNYGPHLSGNNFIYKFFSYKGPNPKFEDYLT